jgi:hypothetical protein
VGPSRQPLIPQIPLDLAALAVRGGCNHRGTSGSSWRPLGDPHRGYKFVHLVLFISSPLHRPQSLSLRERKAAAVVSGARRRRAHGDRPTSFTDPLVGCLRLFQEKTKREHRELHDGATPSPQSRPATSLGLTATKSEVRSPPM